eukprot:CAMPEP_0172900904 /NCGR_PEP_ID=MMETSP1075-20121228/165067_1 /TAXON_ID=2916 /ORGANISM="Ceratium fusus, Strain PA161109" /LENGTH=159 /DNA_ID=CAMNT_0013757187 /DNA_START=288 /DNA_END=767 /DNA_ORIENTATION=-
MVITIDHVARTMHGHQKAARRKLQTASMARTDETITKFSVAINRTGNVTGCAPCDAFVSRLSVINVGIVPCKNKVHNTGLTVLHWASITNRGIDLGTFSMDKRRCKPCVPCIQATPQPQINEPTIAALGPARLDKGKQCASSSVQQRWDLVAGDNLVTY